MNIRIYINSIEIMAPKNCTLSQALALWLANGTKDHSEAMPESNTDNYVTALNQKFISRALYDTTLLNNDDDIELLTPMAGG